MRNAFTFIRVPLKNSQGYPVHRAAPIRAKPPAPSVIGHFEGSQILNHVGEGDALPCRSI